MRSRVHNLAAIALDSEVSAAECGVRHGYAGTINRVAAALVLESGIPVEVSRKYLEQVACAFEGLIRTWREPGRLATRV